METNTVVVVVVWIINGNKRDRPVCAVSVYTTGNNHHQTQYLKSLDRYSNGRRTRYVHPSICTLARAVQPWSKPKIHFAGRSTCRPPQPSAMTTNPCCYEILKHKIAMKWGLQKAHAWISHTFHGFFVRLSFVGKACLMRPCCSGWRGANCLYFIMI